MFKLYRKEEGYSAQKENVAGEQHQSVEVLGRQQKRPGANGRQHYFCYWEQYFHNKVKVEKMDVVAGSDAVDLESYSFSFM